MHQVLSGGSPRQRAIINRIYDNPCDFGRWEAAHYRLMKSVAGDRSPAGQCARLRRLCCSLVSRTALFDSLRKHRVTGQPRKTLFEFFYHPLAYDRAVLLEHRHFLCASSSLICVDHLEANLLKDRHFLTALDEYQDHYLQYFALFCDRIVAETSGDDFVLEPIVGEMKSRLARLYAKLLLAPVSEVPRAH